MLHGSALVLRFHSLVQTELLSQPRSSGHLAFATGHNLQRNPSKKLRSYVAPEFIFGMLHAFDWNGCLDANMKDPFFGSLLLGSSPGRSVVAVVAWQTKSDCKKSILLTLPFLGPLFQVHLALVR